MTQQPTQGAMVHPGVQLPGTDETAVYRLFDDAGRLLYVGVGRNPMNRWSAHADQHEWWPTVATFTVNWHATRAEAAAEERHALRNESPVHNLHGTPRWAGIVSQHVRSEIAGRTRHKA